MNINIVCIGKLKEAYWRDACSEYIKRLGAYCSVDIIELKETKLVGEGTKAELAVIESEGRDILSKLDSASDAYIIALDVKGKKLSSEGLAEKIDALALEGKSNIYFIIGGSLVVLGLLSLLIWGIIRLFRQEKRLEERSKRSLSRMDAQEKNEFF